VCTSSSFSGDCAVYSAHKFLLLKLNPHFLENFVQYASLFPYFSVSRNIQFGLFRETKVCQTRETFRKRPPVLLALLFCETEINDSIKNPDLKSPLKNNIKHCEKSPLSHVLTNYTTFGQTNTRKVITCLTTLNIIAYHLPKTIMSKNSSLP
jgi:hypothetical protein